ncbi:TTF-type domain-containing protein [Trichonephila clavipes]|uniref:TTF-type domain-containing protein n=1 Tax=Trichonephila clavipes TaxID=2585209 RepID=A0A8X6SII8_TRICX|nr:TTF-type domain-containing protein [Trichonephila clavipes]
MIDKKNTKEDMAYMFQWVTLEKEIKRGKTLDTENERRILGSQKHWYNLFERLIDIKNFLDYHNNLTFRGHRESLKIDEGTKNSVNFIGLFKLISKYDPTLRKHINCIDNKQLVTNLYGTFPLIFLGVFWEIINLRIFPINSKR